VEAATVVAADAGKFGLLKQKARLLRQAGLFLLVTPRPTSARTFRGARLQTFKSRSE
jgi:hypothetical protein